MNKKVKSSLILLLSFVLPAAGFALIYLQVQVYPGGDFTLLTYDMKHIFAPMFASLRYINSGASSILYSFFGGLGHTYIGNYLTNVGSPLSWITVLWPIEKLPDAIYFLTLIKIGLCGSAMAAFLLFREGKKTEENDRVSWYIVLFACCYALMSYNMMYNMCLFFTDGVIMLPLVWLGTERIVQGKKGFFYIGSLSLSIYFGFYISWMVAIAGGLYFLICISGMTEGKTKNEKAAARIWGRFIIDSIIAALLASPVIVLALREIGKGTRTSYGFDEWTRFHFYEIFAKFLSANYDSVTSYGLPSLFCGTCILLLAVLYFFVSSDTKRQKIVTGFVMLFMILSFWLSPLDVFWHGGSRANDFPFREAFVWSALTVMLAWKVLPEFKRFKPIYVKYARFLFVFLTIVELYLNGAGLVHALNAEICYGTSEEYSYIADVYKKLDEVIDDNSFYRIRVNSDYSRNEPTLFGYNGLDFFSSIYDEKTAKMMEILGLYVDGYEINDAGSTAATDVLLGVKYVVNVKKKKGVLEDNPAYHAFYEKMYEDKNIEIWENKYALPIAFLGEGGLFDEIPVGENSYEVMNKLFCGIRNKAEDCFYKIECQNIAGNEIEFTTDSKVIYIGYNYDEEQRYELYGEWKYNNSKSIFEREKAELPSLHLVLNGENLGECFWKNSYRNICQTNEKFKKENILSLSGNVDVNNIYIYGMNQDVLGEAKRLNAEPNVEVKKNKTGFSVNCICTRDENLYFSIPYDKAWRVWVDGEQRLIDEGILMSVPLTAGKHSVQIEYSLFK